MDEVDVTARVRRATPADVDAMEDYHHRCFLKTYASQLRAGEFGTPDRDGTREQLHGWFEPGSRFETWVASAGDEVIGHVTILDHHLVHLFVDPDHHGTGLGRRLLQHGESLIAAQGHTDAELHARVENIDAIAFYEHAGWAVTDRTIHTAEHGIAYDERILVKRLAPSGRDPTSS